MWVYGVLHPTGEPLITSLLVEERSLKVGDRKEDRDGHDGWCQRTLAGGVDEVSGWESSTSEEEEHL